VNGVLVIGAAQGLGGAAERVGVAAAALLAAVAVLGRPGPVSERARALAMLGALVLTPVLLVADIWNTTQMHSLRHRPVLAVLAAVLGVALVGALAVAIRRRPAAIALLAVGALPFRLPISTGGTTANLLIPLYLVVAGGALAHLIPPARGMARAAGRGGDDVAPTRLEWLLMASVTLYALQAAYSTDFSRALEQVVFFYVPFALLFALLRRVRWTPELLLACFVLVVALAVIFAGIGFVEYSGRHLLLNPKVVAANQFDNYFRVNSLFFDPSIYGRFLALVMIAATVAVLWSERRRDVLVGAAVLLWLLGGLVTSFSQSSITALLVGLAVLAALRWRVRPTLYACAGLLGVTALFLLLAPRASHVGVGGSPSANNATSGRYALVVNGLRLFADRPLQGWGPGSFSLQYTRHNAVTAQNATSASHTIPVTVAAEQGVVGLALYLALLGAAFLTLFASAARRSPARIAIAAAFAALVVHTLTYADFLEDPMTWTLLGVGVALAEGRPRREPADRADSPGPVLSHGVGPPAVRPVGPPAAAG